jgi:hypothetical protein
VPVGGTYLPLGARRSALGARRSALGARRSEHDRAVFVQMSPVQAAMVLCVVTIVSAVMTWAVYTRRRRLWLVFVLATLGTVSAEVFAVIAYVVLLGATSEAPLVALGFAALSIASFVGVAKQPVRDS